MLKDCYFFLKHWLDQTLYVFPAIKRLLGSEGSFGEELGLSNDWALDIISQVGNYGESYEKNVGPNTPLKLDRGVNALWSQGGILYAAPVR